MRKDVFVSHAWEDKRYFVKQLADILISKGAMVWYDQYSLRGGESLREAIDKGLSTSRFGIVVLSTNFFRKGWTKAELDGMFVEDSKTLGNHIIPVWHKVDAAEVEKYSRILKGRVGIPSKIGVKAVAERLLLRIRPDLSEKLATRKVPPYFPARMVGNPYTPATELNEANLVWYLKKLDPDRDWIKFALPIINQYNLLDIRYINGLDDMLEDSFCIEVLESLYERILGRKFDSLGRATFLPFIYLKNNIGVEYVTNALLASPEYLEKAGE